MRSRQITDRISIRTTGANVVVELDGETAGSFDHIEGQLRDAKMQADAFAQGLAYAEAPPRMRLFSWESEALGSGTAPATVAAIAPDADTAREKITSHAGMLIRVGHAEVSFSQLEVDLEREPSIEETGTLIVLPG